MFDDWDAVRARLWNAMTTSTDINDDDFFRGLPVQASDQSTKRLNNEKNDGKGGKKSKKCSQKRASAKGGKARDDRHAFSAYSFSSSAVVDDKGRQVTSMRRRYEDSSGRLKAVHERQVEGRKLRTTWDRNSKEDKGRLESVCSSGTPDEFEAMWSKTPIGRAEKRIIKEQGEEKATAGDENDNLPRSKL